MQHFTEDSTGMSGTRELTVAAAQVKGALAREGRPESRPTVGSAVLVSFEIIIDS